MCNWLGAIFFWKEADIYTYLSIFKQSWYAAALILSWASLCVIFSVLSPSIATITSPGHRLAAEALLPGVICNKQTNLLKHHTYLKIGREKSTMLPSFLLAWGGRNWACKQLYDYLQKKWVLNSAQPSVVLLSDHHKNALFIITSS